MTEQIEHKPIRGQALLPSMTKKRDFYMQESQTARQQIDLAFQKTDVVKL